jgi:hypothetical protein
VHVLPDGTRIPVFRGSQGSWVAYDVGPLAPFRAWFLQHDREPVPFSGGEAPFAPRAVPR